MIKRVLLIFYAKIIPHSLGTVFIFYLFFFRGWGRVVSNQEENDETKDLHLSLTVTNVSDISTLFFLNIFIVFFSSRLVGMFLNDL